MYQITRSVAVTADNPDVAFTQSTLGDAQVVYLVVENLSGVTPVSITKDGANATSPFELGVSETWMFGPILGKNLASHALFAAAPADTLVSYLVAPTELGVTTPAGSPAEGFARAVISHPLVWRQLA